MERMPASGWTREKPKALIDAVDKTSSAEWLSYKGRTRLTFLRYLEIALHRSSQVIAARQVPRAAMAGATSHVQF